jgi:transcriptional regulator with XRE-family HTH domain
MLTPAQCRAARALLDWTQATLARKAGVGWSTIKDFENGRHVLIRANMTVVKGTLEEAGIVLLAPEGGYGPGVRLRAENGADGRKD